MTRPRLRQVREVVRLNVTRAQLDNLIDPIDAGGWAVLRRGRAYLEVTYGYLFLYVEYLHASGVLDESGPGLAVLNNPVEELQRSGSTSGTAGGTWK